MRFGESNRATADCPTPTAPHWVKGLKVAVIGAGRSGIDSARVLSALGARVSLFDRATPAQLGDLMPLLTELEAQKVSLFFGMDIPPNLSEYQLLIVSPGLRPTHPLFQLAAQHNIPVWSEIELAGRIARAPIIAITGTNGKTTTTVLTAHVLSAMGIRAHLCGNIAGTDDDQTLVSAAFQAEPEDWLVAEVSSFQLLHTRQFHPHIAVITNITVDHLDYHGSWEAYARAKGNILRNLTENDWAVLNARDKGTAQLLSWLRAEGHKGLSALETAGHLRLFLPENPVVPMRDGELDLSAHSPLPIPHSPPLENLLACAHVASVLGCERETFRRTLADFRGVPHRMEWVGEWNGVRFINNSMCTNAEALERSLQACPKPCIAIAGGVDKNRSASALADSLARYCRYTLLIGRDGEAIRTALNAIGYPNAEYVGTLEQAVARALQLARDGDTVILAPGCASFDQFRNFIERGNRFKTLVKEVIT